ncbi:MAG TPA: hypothetical protein DD381_05040 [Lentisphaeria bacterium]|nr:MAG: hypothetical protein A2X47_06375 [Lentisphaerae bacterium GWF2_38_69]HBM15696.1 hypothetical protein [Lentisphaeria bacterium]
MIMPVRDPELAEVRVLTSAFFGSQTPLEEAEKYGGRPYEERPQQKEMAQYVAESLIASENLCIEAPTGVGKSFAYLIPSIYYSLKKKKPVIVTTETINLQEQLVNKDIPILKELMETEFTACLAKGRGNYVCRRKLELTTGNGQSEYLPSNSMVPEIVRIAKWSETTFDGTLADLGFEPQLNTWLCVCCEAVNCFGPKCKKFRDCFYWNARKQWDKANIVVTNHALFLADLKMKMTDDIEGGVLPAYGAVILDEAHQLEMNAAKHLGVRISESGIFTMLNKLYNSSHGRGLLIRPGTEASELRELVTSAFEYTNTFFNSIREYMSDFDDNQKRILKPNIVEDVLTGQLSLLERKLEEYMKLQEDADYKLEITAQLLRCREYTQAVFEFIMMRAEESVYWIETNDNSLKQNATLNYSPLDVAGILKKYLFDKEFPVVLTSATLSVGKKLDFYKKRTGFSGIEKILSSPFDYLNQAKVYIPKSIPDPMDARFEEQLGEYIKKYIEKTSGKAFVLFTSYGLLSKMKQATAAYFEEKGIQLLVQGEGISRSRMIKVFKEDIDSVIFGTTSFWMGVDVPGEALSNVIITKLPFSVPSDPLIEARLEKIRKEGKNAFMEYSLPEAVLKFKQGIGRLIRSKKDTGIIAILDRRIISKQYGRTFLDSMPPCPILIE